MVDDPRPHPSASSPISRTAAGRDVGGDVTPGVAAAHQGVTGAGDGRAGGVPRGRRARPSRRGQAAGQCDGLDGDPVSSVAAARCPGGAAA